MRSANEDLTRQYLTALKAYLARGNEQALHRAYELGRKTASDGLGVLDMARVHEDVLRDLLRQPAAAREGLETARNAGAFLTESLSHFEITHRGFREANRTLRRLNEVLEERNSELAGANDRLKTEIAQRKHVEKELRQSKDHYRTLFKRARQMEANLRYLSSHILKAQEEERKRISRELHDEVGQALTAVNVTLAMLRKAAADAPEELRARIGDAQKLLEQTMETVHSFSRELRPAMLDDLGLIPALRSFVKSFSQRTSIRVQLTATPEAEHLGMEQKIVLYRAAQESLTNIARHAQATEGQLAIERNDNGIRMEIRDNGCSFRVGTGDANPTRKRLGLLGIEERVRLVDGKFHVDSAPGRGTRIAIWIPFQLEAVDHC